MAPGAPLTMTNDNTFLDYLLPGCARFKPHYAPQPLTGNPLDSTEDKLPCISIVIPSFNQAAFLEQAILSVLEQQYQPLELIVVDGGSSDGSLAILQQYSAHLNWWTSEPDRGQAHAINKGFAQSNGSLMAWLNSDDLLLPGALQRVAQAFRGDPQLDIVYGHRIIIDSEGSDIGKWIMPRHSNAILSFADYIPQETMFWRRSLWLSVGAELNETFDFALDWDLLLRFRDSGANFHRLGAFLGAFRRHQAQKTISKISSLGFQEMERLRRQYAGTGNPKLNRLKMRLCLTHFLASARIQELAWKMGLVEIE